MNIADIQAVIDSAVARGTEPLDRYIRFRLPDAKEADVAEVRDVCMEIIDSVPTFMARAEQESEDRKLQHVVGPVLEHIARYFVSPIDLIPEMTYGLAGLLDDAYLVLRILKNLDRGSEPFLDWDLDEPLAFLRGLLGKEMGEKLDHMAMQAMNDADEKFAKLWEEIGARA